MNETTTARIGVCSWSLRETDPRALVTVLCGLGAEAVQLALDPIVDEELDPADTFALFSDAGITVASGMMAPAGEDYTTIDSIKATGGFRVDALWPHHQERAKRLAELAHAAQVPLVTMHAGSFVDRHGAPIGTMVDRIRTVAGIYRDAGVRVAFETGHEPADATLSMIRALDIAGVGINFDPANMILYGSGDPIDALDTLLAHTLQCHVKDAVPSTDAGEWGAEVVVGTGAVDWNAFFERIAAADRRIDLMVERESGDQRQRDIGIALEFAKRHRPDGAS